MHHYRFHIGDYRSATAHLSNDEDLSYRRLLDMYYDQECAIKTDLAWVSRRIRMPVDVVEQVLSEMFELRENGWHHNRCDVEIDAYQDRLSRSSEGGKRSGATRRAKAEALKHPSSALQVHLNGRSTTLQDHLNQPVTSNHKPVPSTQEPPASQEQPIDSSLRSSSHPSGEGKPEPVKARKEPTDLPEGFEEFWGLYGRHGDKKPSAKAWGALTKSDRSEAMAQVEAYVLSTPEMKFRKHASTWLRARGWESEIVFREKPKSLLDRVNEGSNFDPDKPMDMADW